jgi:O-antigen/teichoic acid export membrane protein
MFKELFKKTFIKNFSILTTTNIIVQVLSILSSIRLARQLQPAGYGLFNLVIVQASIFSIIATYGLRTVIIRHIARNKYDAWKVFIISNQIRAITTITAIIAVIGYNQLAPANSLTALFLVALSVLIVFQTFWDTIESISFGFEKMGATGIINLVFTAVWVLEVYIIPDKYFSISVLLYTFVLNQILRSLIYFIWLNNNVLVDKTLKTSITLNDHKEFIKQSNYFFILSVFTAIQNQVPILFLQFNSPIDQIGIFNLGYRLLSPMQMVLNVMLTAIFPLFSRLAIENPNLFARRVKTLLSLILVVGIWGCIGFALFSKDIVFLLYGKLYEESVNVILIQCWYTLLFAIFCIIGTVLSSLDRQKLLSIISFISAVIALPIFYFGTKHGAIGLAWAFVIAAFLNLTYPLVFLHRILHPNLSAKFSIVLYLIVLLLTVGSTFIQFNYPLSIRIAILMIISSFIIYILYKFGYTRIKHL